MKNLQNFDKMTIREILIELIGQPKAEILLQKISHGINEGMQGEELNILICKTLCELGVHKPELIMFLQVIPHVIPE